MKTLITNILLIVLPVILNAQKLSSNDLVNISGKQRMLSQQIAKTAIMNYYGSTNLTVKKEQLISNKIFDKNLVILNDNLFSDKSIYNYLSRERIAYEEFKGIVNNFNSNNAKELMNSANNLLKISNDLVVQIKNNKTLGGGSDLSNKIDLSGKQRMLSQRLAFLFMMEKFKEKLPKGNYHTPILSVIDQMSIAINELSSFSGNTIDIDMHLADISLKLDMIIKEKNKIINGTSSVNFIYQTTNELTKMYDHLTGMYSKL